MSGKPAVGDACTFGRMQVWNCNWDLSDYTTRRVPNPWPVEDRWCAMRDDLVTKRFHTFAEAIEYAQKAVQA